MGLPTYQQLLLPTLQYVCQRFDDIPVSRLEEDIAKALKLSGEDLARVLPSGQQSVFANRLNWARSYLTKAGLMESPRRGFCRGAERGRELIEEGIPEIDMSILSRYPEFVAWRERHTPSEQDLEVETKQSPAEGIASHFEWLNTELSREIIEPVRAFTPAFFERLIVDLLVKMGYGGGRLEMGRALGRVGDGGVDGVIKEDELGLDVVYVQAKRFA